MSSSRDRTQEDTYESQNDQRLDALHSKIRTLRGVTTDIHDDVERQHLILDESDNRFTTFGASLSQTSRRAAQAFGIGQNSTKTCRNIVTVVSFIVGAWIVWKIWTWWIASRHDP